MLSLEKMNRLVDHAADDMTVTVEAGMTFAELSKILAAKNQRLPIDVREPEKATLGGLVAVNQAGPRQFGYGTISDYLLGFTAVDGEGTIFHGGGRVVKNAAGYNMNRLMAGSLGTLGILTQLTFMVRPLPELSAIAACELPDLETAEKLLADLNKSQVRPVAIEFVGWCCRRSRAIAPPDSVRRFRRHGGRSALDARNASSRMECGRWPIAQNIRRARRRNTCGSRSPISRPTCELPSGRAKWSNSSPRCGKNIPIATFNRTPATASCSWKAVGEGGRGDRIIGNFARWPNRSTAR